MLLWFAINVALPFVPLRVVWILSKALRWNKGILNFVADGQLYFFSVTLWAVFLYDGIKAKKFDAEFLTAILFPIIIVPIFYGISIYLVHSPSAVAAPGGQQQQLNALAWISISITIVTVAIIFYARWSIGLAS
jgi:hypothetical protein